MRRNNPRRKPLKKAREKKYNGGIPWLSNKQMEKLRPFFPKSRGKPRVDDQRVLRADIVRAAGWLPLAGCSANPWSLQNSLQPLGA